MLQKGGKGTRSLTTCISLKVLVVDWLDFTGNLCRMSSLSFPVFPVSLYCHTIKNSWTFWKQNAATSEHPSALLERFESLHWNTWRVSPERHLSASLLSFWGDTLQMENCNRRANEWRGIHHESPALHLSGFPRPYHHVTGRVPAQPNGLQPMKTCRLFMADVHPWARLPV